MRTVAIIALLAHYSLSAQQGFNFLQLPGSARVAALGGHCVSAADGDAAMLFHNPAVQDSVQNGDFVLMVNPYFADISRYAALTSFGIGPRQKLSVGTVFTNFGTFQRTDDIGTDNGEFRAGEYVVQVGTSHSVAAFTLGANVKVANSVIDSNAATALLLDIGGIYRHPTRQLYFGMLIKNLGWVLADYSVETELEEPFDVEIGTTFKPEYMPVRFTFTIYDLTDNRTPFSTDEQDLGTVDKVLTHLNVGGALLMGKHIEFLLGYNQRRRQELRLSDGANGAGLSLGVLLRLKDLELRFSRSTFHAAGGTSMIALQSNFNSMKKIF